MKADLGRLLSGYATALSCADDRVFFYAPLPKVGWRIVPVPAALVRCFLNTSVRGHLEYLQDHLRRRYGIEADADVKVELKRVSTFLESVPEHSDKVLLAVAAAILLVVAFAFFSAADIGDLIQIVAPAVTFDAGKVVEEVGAMHKSSPDLFWRFPLFLGLTYGVIHVPFTLAFAEKSRLIDEAPAPSPAAATAASTGPMKRTETMEALPHVSG